MNYYVVAVERRTLQETPWDSIGSFLYNVHFLVKAKDKDEAREQVSLRAFREDKG